MIFDVVVGPSFQPKRNLLPAVAKLFMHLEQEEFFLIGPDFFVDFGVEVVVPSLPALFTGSVELLIALLE